MKNTYAILVLIVAITSNSGFAYADNQTETNNKLVEMLVIAKATGMCGTFKQMTSFQESTKMNGGDEFITRFVNTEAARLGKSLPDFLNQCKDSVETYTKIMDALGYE